MNINSLNLIQKIIISISVSLTVIALFIHNPFSGYTTETNNPLYDSGVYKVPCTKREKDRYRADFETIQKMGVRITEKEEETQAYIDSSVAECTKRVPYKITAPFSEWRTNEPIIYWFGYLANISQLIVVISLIFGAMFFIFKEQSNNK